MHRFIYLYGGKGLKGCLDVDASEPVPLYMYPNPHTYKHPDVHSAKHNNNA